MMMKDKERTISQEQEKEEVSGTRTGGGEEVPPVGCLMPKEGNKKKGLE